MLFILALVFVLCFFIFFASSHRVEKTVIPLSSQEGAEIFMHSQHANYWRLAQYYVTQKNLYFCGVASIVMVLNALDIPAPQLFPEEKYQMFTQDNFFSLKKTKVILKEDDVAWMGMSFQDIAKVLKAFPLRINVVDASDYPFVLFHQALLTALSRDKHYLIACYNRNFLHQTGRGHCSPIAAYDQYSDRVLIMDVSRFDSGPFWVKTRDLYYAMRGTSSSFFSSAGYIEAANYNFFS